MEALSKGFLNGFKQAQRKEKEGFKQREEPGVGEKVEWTQSTLEEQSLGLNPAGQGKTRVGKKVKTRGGHLVISR